MKKCKSTNHGPRTKAESHKPHVEGVSLAAVTSSSDDVLLTGTFPSSLITAQSLTSCWVTPTCRAAYTLHQVVEAWSCWF